MAPATQAVPLPPVAKLPDWLRAELRSNHAGELGSVAIYQGIIAVSKDHRLREFAAEHLHQEEEHMAAFDAWLKPSQRRLLLPVGRVAGFMLGALPALIGRPEVFTAIDAVERLVILQNGSQISQLETSGQRGDVNALLRSVCADEEPHQNDTLQRYPMQRCTPISTIWSSTVSVNSRISVALARRF